MKSADWLRHSAEQTLAKRTFPCAFDEADDKIRFSRTASVITNTNAQVLAPRLRAASISRSISFSAR
jgi:hypothetical protein